MSTPAVITFNGKGLHGVAERLSLYQHWDGYPTSVLPFLVTGIEAAENMVAESANALAFTYKVTPSILKGRYIGDTTSASGMAASPLSDAEEVYAEWRYTVDTEARTIEVSDNDGIRVNPLSYVERLHEEYQAGERVSIGDALAALDALGFRVNP